MVKMRGSSDELKTFSPVNDCRAKEDHVGDQKELERRDIGFAPHR